MLNQKFWQWGRLTTVIIMAVALTGCLPTKSEKPMAVVLDAYSKELAVFIPVKPFTWQYKGTADYVQVMSIADEFETDATKICKIKGEIQDLSSGLSNMDFGLSLTYTISSDAIVQEKKGKAMMDSEFDNLIILKLPIKKGTSWEQPVTYQNGKKSKLKAVITAVEMDGSDRVVSVDYGDTTTHYFEKRKIKEGSGVTAFEKSLNYLTESSIVGYKLDSSESIENQSTENASAAMGPGIAQSASNKNEDEAVKNRIMAFDQGWIEFVNNSSTKIYDSLIKDGQAYKLVQNFKRDGSRQKFEEIRVNQVEILGNKAQAKVYERILQTKSDNTRVLTYNWIYHLTKVKSVWYIDYYEQDTTVKAPH